MLRELREVHHWKKPVICLSVKAKDVADELATYGVTEVLTKPVRPSDVKKAVERALSHAATDESGNLHSSRD